MLMANHTHLGCTAGKAQGVQDVAQHGEGAADEGARTRGPDPPAAHSRAHMLADVRQQAIACDGGVQEGQGDSQGAGEAAEGDGGAEERAVRTALGRRPGSPSLAPSLPLSLRRPSAPLPVPPLCPAIAAPPAPFPSSGNQALLADKARLAGKLKAGQLSLEEMKAQISEALQKVCLRACMMDAYRLGCIALVMGVPSMSWLAHSVCSGCARRRTYSC